MTSAFAATVLICATVFVILMITPEIYAANNSLLKQNFYLKSCPSAERVVRNTVNKAIKLNPGVAAGLIRVFFHDCFVRGCDASILLKNIPGGNETEQEDIANKGSLRGLEVIHEAKAKLEAICPKTVSCADIMAFAARDSTRQVGGFSYKIPSGRRDGTISLASEAGSNLPPLGPMKQIQSLFISKGLTITEMTALLGAHSIGIVQCQFIQSRLYSFNGIANKTDPSLDPKYASFLKKKCPPNSLGNRIVNLDVVTPNKLDSQYYTNVMNKKGVLAVDQALLSIPAAAQLVALYARSPDVWAAEFSEAMVRLGSMDVLTGNKGEIRLNCELVN